MKNKSEFLLNISWYIGLIALIGGWLIFIIWVLVRYLYAINFISLEIIGFFWMIVFFLLTIIAVVFLIIYVFINSKNLHIKMFYTILLILSNIPSVLFILYEYDMIEKKAFVSITNQSGYNISQIKRIGFSNPSKLGPIQNGLSKVFWYEPNYIVTEERIYTKNDNLSLIIFYNNKIDTINFPTIHIGECRHYIFDRNFKLLNNTKINSYY